MRNRASFHASGTSSYGRTVDAKPHPRFAARAVLITPFFLSEFSKTTN